MSLKKAIHYGKEHRKPYRKAKAISKHCRNHGGCPYCRENRMYRTIRELQRTEYELKEDI